MYCLSIPLLTIPLVLFPAPRSLPGLFVLEWHPAERHDRPVLRRGRPSWGAGGASQDDGLLAGLLAVNVSSGPCERHFIQLA